MELVIALIAGILLLFLVAIIGWRYRVQQKKFEREQEILKAKLEIQEKIVTDASRDIHDNVAQILAVVNLTLYSVKTSDNEVKEQVKSSIDLVNQAIGDLRGISRILNSDDIRIKNLSFLLQREIKLVNGAGAFVELQRKGEEVSIESSKQLIIFRIAQQCIQNAIKHSEASKIQVLVEYRKGYCTLKVEDDGNGFTSEEIKGNGFANIYTRAEIINARFQVVSESGKGTKVTLSTPLT